MTVGWLGRLDRGGGGPHLKAVGFLLGRSDRDPSLRDTLHPAIFWEMVKFVDLDVVYLSLVLPRQPTRGLPEAKG